MEGEAPAAVVTGGARGIGRGIAEALARAGFAVTVLDQDGPAAAAVARGLGPRAGRSEQVDVTDSAAQARAFAACGRLDVAVLNAGIGGEPPFLAHGSEKWRKILRVNLEAQLEGFRQAHRHMAKGGGRGVIIMVASSGGVFPMDFAPSYAASKAGVVQFVKSIAGPHGLGGRKSKIQVTALCPAYTDTALVQGGVRLNPGFKAHVDEVSGGRLLTVEELGEIAVMAASDRGLHGQALLVLSPRKGERGPRMYTAAGGRLRPYYEAVATAPRSAPAGAVPASYRRIVVARLSDDFRKATEIVEVPMPAEIPEGRVLVRRLYVGVNASDVNFSAGRYHGVKAARSKLPFPAGFESVGVVVAAGKGVRLPVVGAAVASMEYGNFSEFGVHKARNLIPVPEPSPEMVALLTSGLTASIALEEAGMRRGQTVLVTAAAGGTGQFAVQLAKAAGNHVVATCGNARKVELLKRLGADRVVNYREEDLKAVLKAEYRKVRRGAHRSLPTALGSIQTPEIPSMLTGETAQGVDLVYDGVGGAMFEAAVAALAQGGKIIIIGMIGGGSYTKGWPRSRHEGVNEMLLFKGASVQGFFLVQHARLFPYHMRKLFAMLKAGQLHVAIDATPFVSLDAVAAAVDHLHSGRSQGKVVVGLGHAAAGASARL